MFLPKATYDKYICPTNRVKQPYTVDGPVKFEF